MAFGRLERSQESRPMSDINVTPLVDVMLVLVVIFILTAPLLASAIRLDLPRAEGAQPGATAEKPVTVSMDANGKIYLNDEALEPQAFGDGLRRLAARHADAEVQLRADTTVPYGRVVELMGELNKAGLHRIAFVTEPVPSSVR
ncbi:ExbD/TolR family protein [Diaphorobacter aerolatus]|uniref:Biopolymer transporter ExbD n=1 Tax=Diaphorobacter aerolatus TaxID=1288495 RepID=A0A7H0GH17_9BURK|nr:biopolymer transporter ExbD [Diaphorobacter aerolatus]QNP47583.1 biopolymer transporter ExbD [Diaphorobacter aerolatus]